MDLNPDLVKAVLGSGGVSGLVFAVFAWILSAKREQKKIANGNGNGASFNEKLLFKGQRALSDTITQTRNDLTQDIRDNRKEAREDSGNLFEIVNNMAKHGSDQRTVIFDKLDFVGKKIDRIKSKCPMKVKEEAQQLQVKAGNDS